MSEQSEQIGELAAALAIAQGKITGALKDSANPFFKSKYADLANVWDACRGPLSENGIAVIQTTEPDDRGVVVTTTLAHKSGQWMRGKLLMIPKDSTPQGVGSAITYGRRYALAAVVGVAQVDDDGNAASGRAVGSGDASGKGSIGYADKPRGVTTVDPRGDLAGKSDPQVVAKWVEQVKTALTADPSRHAPLIHLIHTELCSDEGLYIDVCDELDRSGVLGKGKWKEMVRHGNPKQIKKAS